MKIPQFKGEAFRFVLVGILATLLHYALYLLLGQCMNATLAYTLGYAASFVVNFYLTTYFTFRTTFAWHKLAGLLGTHAVNYLLHILLLNLYLVLGVPQVIAPIPVYMVAIPVTFLLARYVFKKKS